MAEAMARSALFGVEFPLNEASYYDVMWSPTRKELACAAANWGKADSSSEAMVMFSEGIWCRMRVKGYVYTSNNGGSVAFVGEMTRSGGADAKWWPCFGDLNFGRLDGKMIVRDHAPATVSLDS